MPPCRVVRRAICERVVQKTLSWRVGASVVRCGGGVNENGTTSATLRDGVGAAVGVLKAPEMGVEKCPGKRRGRGGEAGAEDKDSWAERVRSDAAYPCCGVRVAFVSVTWASAASYPAAESSDVKRRRVGV